MEHSAYFEFLSVQYRAGLSKERLKKAVVKEYITEAEYKEITGEDYIA